jgi:hypothetical protein
MRNILDILSEKHIMWIKYVMSFGCQKDIAEDYVQEMYIKLYDYNSRKENDLMYNESEINYYFVYVTLKNMYYDNIRISSRIIKVKLEDYDFIDDEDYSEDEFNLKNEKVICWVQFIDNQIEINKGYTEAKAQLYYIKSLFQYVLVEKQNVTELSKKLKISYWSIRNTINIIKRQIRDEF